MRVVQLDMWMLALAICGVAQAQNPPSRPLRIVTVAPGSANDIVARLIAHDFKTASGQPVIVDNRGTIAADVVAKAPPDGHTLLLYGSAVWISPFIFRNEATSALNQLAPITLVASSPNVIVVHPSMPVKSARELIALAKRRPGELHYATGSLGAAPHLAAELFKAMAGVNVVRVPYKGTGGSLIGLLSGEVEMMFPTAGSVTAHIKAGKLRPLAVTSLKPTALAPGLPTLSETLPGYESVSLNGMFAPARTSPAFINDVQQEVARILGKSEVKERLANAGMDAVFTTPEEFGGIIKSEMTKWSKVIRDARIAAD
jgi:tripartite-type tricarboxylate transporter receptor subunit TctC